MELYSCELVTLYSGLSVFYSLGNMGGRGESGGDSLLAYLYNNM